jgi:hypothetical protein
VKNDAALVRTKGGIVRLVAVVCSILFSGVRQCSVLFNPEQQLFRNAVIEYLVSEPERKVQIFGGRQSRTTFYRCFQTTLSELGFAMCAIPHFRSYALMCDTFS